MMYTVYSAQCSPRCQVGGLGCTAQPLPRQGPLAPCHLHSLGSKPGLGPSQGMGNKVLGVHHPIRLNAAAWQGLQGFWGLQEAAGPAQGESGQLFPYPGGKGNLQICDVSSSLAGPWELPRREVTQQRGGKALEQGRGRGCPTGTLVAPLHFPSLPFEDETCG